MQKNKLLWLMAILLFMVNGLQAQTRVITGKVTSSTNEVQPGASVIVKGTNKGTVTDANGNYNLSVPNGDVTVVVSIIGFNTMEKLVGANVSAMDFSLTENASTLNEVVVTALGISREKKTLVYATQTVKPTELVEARDPNNVINSLSGKIANAVITQGSGGARFGCTNCIKG